MSSKSLRPTAAGDKHQKRYLFSYAGSPPYSPASQNSDARFAITECYTSKVPRKSCRHADEEGGAGKYSTGQEYEPSSSCYVVDNAPNNTGSHVTTGARDTSQRCTSSPIQAGCSNTSRLPWIGDWWCITSCAQYTCSGSHYQAVTQNFLEIGESVSGKVDA